MIGVTGGGLTGMTVAGGSLEWWTIGAGLAIDGGGGGGRE